MYGDPVTVVRVRSGGFDERGDPLPDTEAAIEGGTIAPAGTIEDGAYRASSTAEWTFFAPPGSGIESTDRFRLPAKYAGSNPQLYEVVGDTQVWSNPFTGEYPGDAIELKRRSG